jgi:hypothetical protein
MALELSNVHEMAREEGTNRMILVRKNPYARFVRQGQAPIIVQDGRFYPDEGEEYKKKDIPDWIWKELKKRDREALHSIGINPDTLGRPAVEKPAPKAEPDPIQTLNPLPDLDEQVRGALARLDPTEDAHWTKSGKPDLNAISEMLGRRVTRVKVNELMPDLTRPNFGD